MWLDAGAPLAIADHEGARERCRDHAAQQLDFFTPAGEEHQPTRTPDERPAQEHARFLRNTPAGECLK